AGEINSDSIFSAGAEIVNGEAARISAEAGLAFGQMEVSKLLKLLVQDDERRWIAHALGADLKRAKARHKTRVQYDPPETDNSFDETVGPKTIAAHPAETIPGEVRPLRNGIKGRAVRTG